ncbi:chymotrypsin-like elastase family member 2A [Montipora capricornis]|uniref:chymotrypsin-like elastase family member 2A n=1 Tax=Montipora capricornis TaxID=246305 RepID=UPI0035F1773E
MKPAAFAITFTALVFILDSTQTQECGITGDDLRKRVVNGKDATAHSWPWMVSLRYNGRHICGGSLIKVNWVVTAAHCVERDRPIGSYMVVLGSHRRTSTTKFQRSYNLKKIIIHEGYHRNHLRNDIAVLQLEASVDTSLQVNVVCFPKAENRVEPGKKCYITGWGRTVGGGNDAITLQEAPLPVADIKICSRINGMLRPVDDKTMLCAGGEGIAGGCQASKAVIHLCQ